MSTKKLSAACYSTQRWQYQTLCIRFWSLKFSQSYTKSVRKGLLANDLSRSFWKVLAVLKLTTSEGEQFQNVYVTTEKWKVCFIWLKYHPRHREKGGGWEVIKEGEKHNEYGELRRDSIEKIESKTRKWTRGTEEWDGGEEGNGKREK